VSEVTVDLCVRALRRALPFADVAADRMRFGERARASVGTGSVIRYAYLALAADERFELHLYPADTLSQARVFYRDRARVVRLLSLRDRGWRIEPNFHFGFMERGLTWTETRVSVDAYVSYWLKEIATTRVLRRDEWKTALDRLIRARIATEGDVPQFRSDFDATERQTATPRPGLRVVYPWPNHRIGRHEFADDLRARIDEAFRALGEPVAEKL
jgi:hypothetical protein